MDSGSNSDATILASRAGFASNSSFLACFVLCWLMEWTALTVLVKGVLFILLYH